MSKKRVHLIYKILLSVSLMVMGACLIVACVGIYLSGDRPFSAEAVATAFSGIAIPVYLCLILILGGFLLDGFIPPKQPKLTAAKQHAYTLEKLKGKLDMELCCKEIKQKLTALKKKRSYVYFAVWLITLLSISDFYVYASDPTHFDSVDINGSMIAAAIRFGLSCLIILSGGIFNVYFNGRCDKKEITLVKEAIAAGAVKTEVPAPAVKKPNATNIVRFAILGIGIAIFVYGFITGGTADVLTKAVNICTECVGLG